MFFAYLGSLMMGRKNSEKACLFRDGVTSFALGMDASIIGGNITSEK